VEVVFVVFAELPLPEDPVLPPGERQQHVREEPEGVVRGEDWKANDITEEDEEEETLQRGAPLPGLLDVLIEKHAVKELPDRLAPPAAVHAVLTPPDRTLARLPASAIFPGGLPP
jgi:hypothetical protein